MNIGGRDRSAVYLEERVLFHFEYQVITYLVSNFLSQKEQLVLVEIEYYKRNKLISPAPGSCGDPDELYPYPGLRKVTCGPRESPQKMRTQRIFFLCTKHLRFMHPSRWGRSQTHKTCFSAERRKLLILATARTRLVLYHFQSVLDTPHRSGCCSIGSISIR